MSLCVARRTLPLHLPFTVKRCIFSYTAYKQHCKQVNTASCCEFNGIQNWANFYDTPIGNRMRSVEWCHLNDLEWLLTQIISSASHYLRTEVEYLRNSMRHSYNEISVATYTRPTQRCNYEWPWVILSDLTFPTTRAASLRQLSFLLVSVLKVTVLVLVMCQLYLVFRDQDRDSFKIACAIYSQRSHLQCKCNMQTSTAMKSAVVFTSEQVPLRSSVRVIYYWRTRDGRCLGLNLEDRLDPVTDLTTNTVINKERCRQLHNHKRRNGANGHRSSCRNQWHDVMLTLVNVTI